MQLFLKYGPRSIVGLDLVNASDLFQSGNNTTLGSTYETIWPEGGLKVYRSTAATFTLSSTSANDAAAGTGARTVLISGVGADWVRQTETVTLNGLTGVSTAKTWMIIHRLEVITAGSSGWHEGTVYAGTGTITTGKPAVVEALLSRAGGIGENRSEMGFFPVPADHELLLLDASTGVTSNKQLTAGLYVKPNIPDGVFSVRGKRNSLAVPIVEELRTPARIPEKTIIEARGFVDAGDADVTFDFQAILIDNR
jgi:hypothetical protein